MFEHSENSSIDNWDHWFVELPVIHSSDNSQVEKCRDSFYEDTFLFYSSSVNSSTLCRFCALSSGLWSLSYLRSMVNYLWIMENMLRTWASHKILVILRKSHICIFETTCNIGSSLIPYLEWIASIASFILHFII